MSKKKEKVPIVRFKAFSAPWFQNQLSEVAEFSKGRGYSKKDLQSHGIPIILYGRLYTNYESEISNVETYANLEENSVVSEGGEVIIPASGESADDISRASCVIDRGIILGGDLNIVRPHEYLNSLFIAITLSNGSQQRELSKRAQGKSVVHLHNSDLKAVKLFYPSYEEQSAIGSLFRTLDDLLSSFKDNLANYQSFKASILSKMFPKVGHTAPEIRLDGFEGEWKSDTFESYLTESRILGDSGLDAKKITVKLWGKGVVEKEEKYAGSSNTQYYIRKAGQFIYSKLDFQNQAFGIVPTELDGYQSTLDLPTFDVKGIDTKFLLEYIMRKEFYEYQGLIANGSRKAKRIHPDDFLSMPVRIPSLAEQQAIGDYFSNLDQLITSYQEKITQLETLKKKLLQDMFI